MQKISKTELDEVLDVLGFADGMETASDFPPLSLASPDSYLQLELGTGSIPLRGKLWRIAKYVHEKGMTEILTIQTVNAKQSPGNWVLLQYSNHDPNSSIVDSFDFVPRKMVDPDATKHIYYLMIGALSLIVFLLFYLLFKGYEFRPTWETMLSILSLGLLGIFTILYESWKTEYDYVSTATLFIDAPPYPRNYVVRHPITGEAKTISGKVIPVGVKSSKVPISQIRGFSVDDIAKDIEFTKEIEDFEEEYYTVEIEYELMIKDIETSKQDIKRLEKAKQLSAKDAAEKSRELDTKLDKIKKQYSEKKQLLEEKKRFLLLRFDELITTGEFDARIQDVKKKIEADMKDKKIAEELFRRKKERETDLKRIARLELALEDARKEINMWMAQANAEVVTKNATVGARVAQALQRKAFIASYSGEELPGVSMKKMTIPAWIYSALAGAIVFIASLLFIYSVFSGIRTAFSNMGPWGSFLFGFLAFLISIGLLIITIFWVYNRVNLWVKGTKKVILE